MNQPQLNAANCELPPVSDTINSNNPNCRLNVPTYNPNYKILLNGRRTRVQNILVLITDMMEKRVG